MRICHEQRWQLHGGWPDPEAGGSVPHLLWQHNEQRDSSPSTPPGNPPSQRPKGQKVPDIIIETLWLGMQLLLTKYSIKKYTYQVLTSAVKLAGIIMNTGIL